MLRAIHQAAEGLIHVSNLYWTEPMVTLAERLCGLSGMSRAFFCNSGAESIETAIKWARKARPGRTKLVCFERSFHGRTMGSLSLTAQPKYQKSFLPVLAGIEVIPWGTVEALEAIDETTAGVFVEVVQGEGGVRPAPDGWLPALRERCDRVGALLVLDEVQTGVVRTGTLWAFEQDGIVPDAITLALPARSAPCVDTAPAATGQGSAPRG